MKKTACISTIKRLIKKYHPDLCEDKNLESMYTEITIKLNNALDKLKTAKGEAAALKDQDYEYYRMGIQYYRNIHPNQFYTKNADRTYQLKNHEEQLRALNAIFISFNAAEYFFGKLVDEYPHSPWRSDAEDKLALLKKLYTRYENRTAEKITRIITNERFINEMGLKLLF